MSKDAPTSEGIEPLGSIPKRASPPTSKRRHKIILIERYSHRTIKTATHRPTTFSFAPAIMQNTKFCLAPVPSRINPDPSLGAESTPLLPVFRCLRRSPSVNRHCERAKAHHSREQRQIQDALGSNNHEHYTRHVTSMAVRRFARMFVQLQNSAHLATPCLKNEASRVAARSRGDEISGFAGRP